MLPQQGEIVDGYRFVGGQPADPKAWEEVSEPKVGDLMAGFRYLGGNPSEQKSWGPAKPIERASGTEAPSAFDEFGMQREQADAAPTADTSSSDAGSVGSDVANLLGSGSVAAMRDTRELGHRVLRAMGGGITPSTNMGVMFAAGYDILFDKLTGRKPDDVLKDVEKNYTDKLTPEQVASSQKLWWDDDKGELGPAWSDPRAYLSGVAQSLPEEGLMMLPPLALARSSYLAKIAAGMTPEAAATAAARTAMLTGAISEGSLGGAQSSRQVRDQISEMKPEDLEASDAYRALLASGMTPEQARSSLAESAATQAFVLAGVTTGIFGGMGDRIMARAVTKGVEGGIAKRILLGMVSEGVLEEFPQNYLQQVSENIAMRSAKPEQSLTEGALNQAFGGLAVGAVQGGAMTGALGHSAKAAARETASTVRLDGNLDQQVEAINSAPVTTPTLEAGPEDVGLSVAPAKTAPPEASPTFDFKTTFPEAAPESGVAPEKVSDTHAEVIATLRGALDENEPETYRHVLDAYAQAFGGEAAHQLDRMVRTEVENAGALRTDEGRDRGAQPGEGAAAGAGNEGGEGRGRAGLQREAVSGNVAGNAQFVAPDNARPLEGAAAGSAARGEAARAAPAAGIPPANIPRQQSEAITRDEERAKDERDVDLEAVEDFTRRSTGEVKTFKSEKAALAYQSQATNRVPGNFKPRLIEGEWRLSRPRRERTPAQKANDLRLARERARINPAKDSLATAIGKLGGIKADELLKDGVDRQSLRDLRSGVVGKPAYRTKGGLSLDALAEILDGYGFDVRDEHGAIDATKLRDLIQQEIDGDRVYTPEGYERLASMEAEERDREARARLENDFSEDELRRAGYDDLSEEARAFVEAAFNEEQDAHLAATWDTSQKALTDDEADRLFEEGRAQPQGEAEAALARGEGEGADHGEAAARGQGEPPARGPVGTAEPSELDRLIARYKPGNPFAQRAARARLAADRGNTPTQHERGMAAAFPLGAGFGRPGGEKRIERSVDRAVRAVQAEKDARYLEGQAESFDAGKINAQGRAISKASLERSEKREVAGARRDERIAAARAERGDKPAWQIPRDVYADSTGYLGGGGRRLIEGGHREAVERAIAQGESARSPIASAMPSSCSQSAPRRRSPSRTTSSAGPPRRTSSGRRSRALTRKATRTRVRSSSPSAPMEKPKPSPYTPPKEKGLVLPSSPPRATRPILRERRIEIFRTVRGPIFATEVEPAKRGEVRIGLRPDRLPREGSARVRASAQAPARVFRRAGPRQGRKPLAYLDLFRGAIAQTSVHPQILTAASSKRRAPRNSGSRTTTRAAPPSRRCRTRR
jgi:hypothetical protein